MRKLLFWLLLAIFISMNLSAQVTVTVNVPTVGGFSAALSAAGGDKTTVTNLTITGNIDARDVKFMRDSMPVLAVLDLEAVEIKSYLGSGGTSKYTTSYAASRMPDFSFFKSSETLSVPNKTLTTVKFPNTITTIGKYAFHICIELNDTIKIPNSVTTICESAFSGCSKLFVVLSSSVVSIEGFIDGAFTSCTISGNLPSSINTIGQSAFFGCNFTGTLKIPNGITTIPVRSFEASTFSNIVLPNTLKTIENIAFNQCCTITGNLIIPNSVTTIKKSFCNCINIPAIYIPKSVSSLGSGAFDNCIGLKKFVIDKVLPLTIDTATFTGVNKTTCELIVPTGSKAAYQAAIGWGLFQNITEAIFVTLNTQGGQAAAPITTTIYNSTIAEPAIPIRDGFIFAGWYKEVACSNAWNFAADVVTAPITLYVKWGIATSVENLQPTNFKIYPNPATSTLYIDNLSRDAKVDIISLDGKTVKQQKSFENNGNIDISNLPKGVYLLKINSKAGSQVQRFVKQSFSL